MEIVLLHVPDCPNRTDTRRNLDAALTAAGRTGTVVGEREVRPPAEAVAAGMHGSPTILVDGDDLFAADPCLPPLPG